MSSDTLEGRNRRRQIDELVWSALLRARRPLSASELSKRVDVGQVAVTYSLQRLAVAKRLYVSTEMVDTPTRVRETLLLYQARAVVKKRQRWPDWLVPKMLPKAVAGIRRKLTPTTDKEDPT